jgi:hypothetical protein
MIIRNTPAHTLKRVFAVVIVVVVLGISASAYTVVMRGGRRIEIPNAFVVTPATLTYETAPGIQITLQLAAIDIPATDKANNEPAGSLLRRVRQSPELTLSQNSDGHAPRPAPARHTITNRDLEPAARRRMESAAAYEARRKQLGLASVAESQRQSLAEPESFELELEQRRVAERESEAYWRERAAALRTEMATLDAELNFTRVQLEESPSGFVNGWNFGSFLSAVPFISLGGVGRRSFGNFGSGRFGGHRPSVFVAPGSGARPLSGPRVWSDRRTQGQVFVNPRGYPHAAPGGIRGGFPPFGGGAVFSSGPAYDYSYERGELITRFNQLAAARAGLNARWRELEDEARRAGAPPGWLRP